jgi:hypothetical protein
VSVEAIQWALYEAPMLTTKAGKPDSTARAVLVVLADKADRDGSNAYPSPLTIAHATGFDERTIDRVLLRLERAGVITRDGLSRLGTNRWRLNLAGRRPDSDWEQLRAAADAERSAQSRARAARRHRQACAQRGVKEPPEDAVSGTQNPGVRHAESRMSGTQRPPTRQNNHPYPPLGASQPPDPLRPVDPPSSDPRNGKTISIYERPPEAVPLVGDHRPRARARTHLPATRCRHGGSGQPARLNRSPR